MLIRHAYDKGTEDSAIKFDALLKTRRTEWELERDLNLYDKEQLKLSSLQTVRFVSIFDRCFRSSSSFSAGNRKNEGSNFGQVKHHPFSHRTSHTQINPDHRWPLNCARKIASA